MKNESNLPWVVLERALFNFLAPFLTLSSLNPLSPHKNFTKPSSSGSVHFNYNIHLNVYQLKKIVWVKINNYTLMHECTQ